VSEGLIQGPYMAARVGFKPATLRTQGIDLATEPASHHAPQLVSNWQVPSSKALLCAIEICDTIVDTLQGLYSSVLV